MYPDDDYRLTPREQREERYAETGVWADALTPAERSAAYVIEAWLCDESTLRHLAGRFISRDDLFHAYRRTLSVLDLSSTTEFVTEFPGHRTDDRHRYAGRVTPQRGPTAGRTYTAGPREFIAVARLYLMGSTTHRTRGWFGVGSWRGQPIYAPNGRSTITVRDRSLIRPSDVPMWDR